MKNYKSKLLQVLLFITTIIGTSSFINNKSKDTKEVAEEKNDQKFGNISNNNNEKDSQFLVNDAEIHREEIITFLSANY